MKILYIDTETTGLDPVKNDIIQVAGIVEIDGQVKERFNLFCRPMNLENINEYALQYNGFDREQLPSFPHPEEAYTRIMKVLEKYVDVNNENDRFIPAGKNVKFDVDFLRAFFQKNGGVSINKYLRDHTFDLTSLAIAMKLAGKLEIESLSLKNIADYFGYRYRAHDAAEDIRVTRKIMRKIIELMKGD